MTKLQGDMSDEPKKPDTTIPTMSDEDLRAFVDGAVSGRLFTSVQVTNGTLLPLVFLPVSMGVFAGWTKEELENVGVIWEWCDVSMPRTINGMPIFMSMRLMNKADWQRALTAIQQEIERRKSIRV